MLLTVYQGIISPEKCLKFLCFAQKIMRFQKAVQPLKWGDGRLYQTLALKDGIDHLLSALLPRLSAASRMHRCQVSYKAEEIGSPRLVGEQ